MNRKFSIVVPEKFMEELELIALAERQSRNALIRGAIKQMIDERGSSSRKIIEGKLKESSAL